MRRVILAKSVQYMFKSPYTGTVVKNLGNGQVRVIRDGLKTKETWSCRLWRKLPDVK